MNTNVKLSREEIIANYQEDVLKLMQFESWIIQKTGQNTTSMYRGEHNEASIMPVPIYDATLLSFVKQAKTTKFINRNYVYTYSRNRIQSAQDELTLISNASLQDMQLLGDILSYYCLKGDTKGLVWSEGVKNGVYLALLEKWKELLEIK